MLRIAALSACALLCGCAQQELTVDFFRSESYSFSWNEQRAIESVARSTLKEVRPLLPALPARIQLTVRPGSDVFERDFAGVKAPWADYPPNVAEWADEIRQLPGDAPSRDWLYSHPDGRRWIGMKVGTYWVDRAMAKSKRSPADLSTMPTRDVLR